MRQIQKIISATFLLLSATMFVFPATAHSAGDKLENKIKTRQAGYKFMAWNMGKLKKMLVDDPISFDPKKALGAAKVVQAVANSGIGSLFVPGSEKTVNGVKTRVKPALFNPAKRDTLIKVATDFNREANKLAEVAVGGDEDAIKEQFGKVGKTCKACHKEFKYKD